MKKDIPKSKIQILESQLKELTEALQRERADSQNLRRRAEEERLQLGNFYKAMVVRELLPVIDDLERALDHAPKELANHAYVKGIQSLAKKFDSTLAGLGLERIKTTSEPFDPRYHEAISLEDKGGEHEMVSEELQAGYKLGEEVIRPAMVRVKREK